MWDSTESHVSGVASERNSNEPRKFARSNQPAAVRSEPTNFGTSFLPTKGRFIPGGSYGRAWCSMGPHGNLHLIFFSERLAIPQETYYPLRADGELGTEIFDKRVGKRDYVREMEVDVVLNWKNVINLHDYLTKYIESNKSK